MHDKCISSNCARELTFVASVPRPVFLFAARWSQDSFPQAIYMQKKWHAPGESEVARSPSPDSLRPSRGRDRWNRARACRGCSCRRPAARCPSRSSGRAGQKCWRRARGAVRRGPGAEGPARVSEVPAQRVEELVQLVEGPVWIWRGLQAGRVDSGRLSLASEDRRTKHYENDEPEPQTSF
jgi:hypothetical protein